MRKLSCWGSILDALTEMVVGVNRRRYCDDMYKVATAAMGCCINLRKWGGGVVVVVVVVWGDLEPET